jgi:hypothetical protein
VRESLAPRLVLSLNAAAAAGRACYSTVGDTGGGAWAWLGDRITGTDRTAAAGAGPTEQVAAELVGAATVCATHSAKVGRCRLTL